MNKKLPALILITALVLTFILSGCKNGAISESSGDTPAETPLSEPARKETAAEITSRLTLSEKVGQMLQPAGYNVSDANMELYGYGSLLSVDGLSAREWRRFIQGKQKAALKSSGGIPFIYGNDAVHGVNTCAGAVIFPHNIGIGAANDPKLTYKMGLAVADEAKLAGMLWSFSPCVASAQDPRWGRTYESYSSETEIVKTLGTEFAKGLMDGGILPCAKHFLGDGEVYYGTGGKSYNNGSTIETLIDRGDAPVTRERFDELLSVYKSLIDAGVKTVMITHGSINGTMAHADKHLITDVLKGELGFNGFVVSDWESIHNIPGASLKEQLVTSVNAGIDMLMQPENYLECRGYIIDAVNEGLISEERINDAVTRIISVKMQTGIFDDPLMENLETKQYGTGSAEYRNLARRLVEKSLVLLKNENSVLPLKEGLKLYITGPAADDTGVLCGGWTFGWAGKTGKDRSHGGKTILDGFNEIAWEYGFTIITEADKANEADITVLCVGEVPYAEWEGDTADLSITGKLALPGNAEAIAEAEKLGKPTVALIAAGRNVIYEEYENKWNAVVMCYLPGSEGNGVANVLAGKVPFTGKLSMPYYSSVEDIRTERVKFAAGYGLEL
jgi:beta-glucosidase